MSAELHVYTDGWTWVVASSPEDARDRNCDFLGERREDYPNAASWRALPDDKPLGVWEEEIGVGEKVTKTCGEWVASNGPGFLCSTEQ